MATVNSIKFKIRIYIPIDSKKTNYSRCNNNWCRINVFVFDEGKLAPWQRKYIFSFSGCHIQYISGQSSISFLHRSFDNH